MLLLKTLRLFAFDNLSQIKSDFDQTLRRSDAQNSVVCVFTILKARLFETKRKINEISYETLCVYGKVFEKCLPIRK